MTHSVQDLPVAALWRRLAAILYDSFLIFAIWIMVGFAVLSAFGIDNGENITLTPLQNWVLFLAMIGSAFLFFGWFWTNSGQTLGMQAWKIKIQNQDGSAVNWRQVGLRFISAPPSMAAGGLGYWWALWQPEKRSWPDLLSHSWVVKVQR